VPSLVGHIGTRGILSRDDRPVFGSVVRFKADISQKGEVPGMRPHWWGGDHLCCLISSERPGAAVLPNSLEPIWFLCTALFLLKT